MLSGLASLLLGVGGEAVVNPQDDCHLKVTVTDDEWQLVDHESSIAEKLEPTSMSSSAHSGVIPFHLHRDSERNSDIEVGLIESSMPELLMMNPRVEESWILAPPPIFTANRRVANSLEEETAPLENLLIEHPSMSVYNSAPIHRVRPTNVLQRSALENAQPAQEVNTHQRHAGHVLSTKKMSAEMQAAMKGQACEHKKAMKAINRGKLERSNKARTQANLGVLRRKSRLASTPSGFCNNRKC